MVKKALISGITGQDGAYLAYLLLQKGYEVHGVRRRSSVPNTTRIDSFLKNIPSSSSNLHLHYGDMTDSSSIFRIVQKTKPDEIYNLAAQSHVAVSFDEPEYTSDTNALGALRFLEAIRILDLKKKTRFYQASTSELYGLVQETPQNEKTPFYPHSPYAVAKLYAYWITINYRNAHDIYACNGILFNHESPMREKHFVTRKITLGLSRIVCGLQEYLALGNLDAKRDWGHTKDYVEMQWLMLQQKKPDDFVIASGTQYSVRDFVNATAKILGLHFRWKNKGSKEIGILEKIVDNPLFDNSQLQSRIGDSLIRVDSVYFRPTEVHSLLGDATKAKNELGWAPSISFDTLVEEMVLSDLKLALREKSSE